MKTMVDRAQTETLWAVLNRAGQIVVIFGGGQAEDEARRWIERGSGYRVTPLADD